MTEAEGQGGRIDWIDTARGLAILLVVLGHVLGGLIDSPLGAGAQEMRTAFLAIYMFHMPLFFLLAGLLVEQRLRRNRNRFLTRLLPTVVWPYFLWSVLQLTAIWSIGALANRPVESIWPGVSSMLWQPVSQFWFLYALFFLHVIASFVLPRYGREALLLGALALKALMLVVDLPFAARLISAQALFYAIGVWLAPQGVERIVASRRPVLVAALWIALASCLIAATLDAAARYAPDLPVALASSPQLANIAWRFPAIAAALAGTLAILALSVALRGSAAAFLAWLGQHTMPIFLLHILFIAGGRILLTRAGMGTSSLDLLVPLVFALGLVFPLAIDAIAQRLRLDRLVGFR